MTAGGLCHCCVGQRGVRSVRGTHEAGAPASPTDVQGGELSVPGEGMCAGGTHSRVGDVYVHVCMCERERGKR